TRALPPRSFPFVLEIGQQIGEALTRVLEVRESVHHRDRGCPREDLQALLLEGPEDDRVDVARQDTARVLDRLAAAQLELCARKGNGVAAHRGDRDLEGDAGP